MGAVLYQSATGLPVKSVISDHICLQWVLHIGVDLANVFNDKQQVHCAQLGDLLVPSGVIFMGRSSFLVYPLALCKLVYPTLVYRVSRVAGGMELKQRGLSNHLL